MRGANTRERVKIIFSLAYVAVIVNRRREKIAICTILFDIMP